METNLPARGPANGQHPAPFRLVGSGKGLGPFELTPEQERQMRDGATQFKPRRQLMRWYFEQKLGVLQGTMDHIWMCTTRTLWLLLLNKGHTRVSRDSILGEIDAKVIVEVFAADSLLFPEYPFGKHPGHDESAPMSQEFDKMREKMAVSLVLHGSRTRAPPIHPRDLTVEEFRAWIVENGLWGIVTNDATNEYSDPLPLPFQKPQTFASAAAASTGNTEIERAVTVDVSTGTTSIGNKSRKGCSEKVKALWEDLAFFEWAKCPSALLPGHYQVIVPHVPELFQLPQGQEVIRCILKTRAIVRRQYYTVVFHSNNQTLVHRYAIGPDLDDGDVQHINRQTANDLADCTQLGLSRVVWKYG
ncbi:unnamed protein product [Clonostachys solani]|uniref:Uncharacterized protein n=1 Tax=Clonostachys solani TaxID=160281 RepID=A0A9N9ZJ55_9HYPO|nr:unnamed protein product [Clonostachys solani]